MKSSFSVDAPLFLALNFEQMKIDWNESYRFQNRIYGNPCLRLNCPMLLSQRPLNADHKSFCGNKKQWRKERSSYVWFNGYSIECGDLRVCFKVSIIYCFNELFGHLNDFLSSCWFVEAVNKIYVKTISRKSRTRPHSFGQSEAFSMSTNSSWWIELPEHCEPVDSCWHGLLVVGNAIQMSVSNGTRNCIWILHSCNANQLVITFWLFGNYGSTAIDSPLLVFWEKFTFALTKRTAMDWLRRIITFRIIIVYGCTGIGWFLHLGSVTFLRHHVFAGKISGGQHCGENRPLRMNRPVNFVSEITIHNIGYMLPSTFDAHWISSSNQRSPVGVPPKQLVPFAVKRI